MKPAFEKWMKLNEDDLEIEIDNLETYGDYEHDPDQYAEDMYDEEV